MQVWIVTGNASMQQENELKGVWTDLCNRKNSYAAANNNFRLLDKEFFVFFKKSNF